MQRIESLRHSLLLNFAILFLTFYILFWKGVRPKLLPL